MRSKAGFGLIGNFTAITLFLVFSLEGLTYFGIVRVMNQHGKVYIGTSGWYYKHWVGPFYPESLDSREFFDYYKRHFTTAEINNTFYQLPQENTIKEWKQAAGESFVYAVKASQYITHMKKLKDPAAATEKFFTAIEKLGDSLGPILFQLPPNWQVNAKRLRTFLKGLPQDYRYAFEFRDKSWFTNQVREILQKHNSAWCVYDIAQRQSPMWVTADFAYIRLHGPGAKAYTGKYEQETLQQWSQRLQNWRQDGRDVYCYFDNDQRGYAPQNAQQLQNMVKS